MNIDCWLEVLSYIPPRERAKFRLVCHLWRELIDYLDLNQKCLQLYSTTSVAENGGGGLLAKQLPNKLSIAQSYEWPQLSLHYSKFVKLFSRYPNLRQLMFIGLTHWNDHHLIRLTELCQSIEKLSFYSCPSLGENYFNDFGFHSVTQLGWQRLSKSYSEHLSILVLEDCDLENYHLQLVVESFRSLRHLNVVNNSDITKFTPLANLPECIEVLKVGPKLAVNSKRIRALHQHIMPIEEILAGAAKNSITTLQLQGCLSFHVTRLGEMSKLEHLTIKYASFSAVEDIFEIENDLLINTLAKLTCLRQFDLYQINQSLSIDLHWLRQKLTSTTSNSSNLHIHRHSPQMKALQSFSMYSTDPLIVVDQYRLIDFILSRTPNLCSFSLACATFDPRLHYNLNQSILLLLQKYGTNLKEVKFENIFPTSLYLYLSSVILSNTNLVKLTIEDRDMLTFLYCLDMQLDEFIANGELVRTMSPLQVTFALTEGNSMTSSREIVNNLQFNHLEDYVKIDFHSDQSDATLRFIERCTADSMPEILSTSQDSDLTDLCQLIDSSFDLIGHLLDLVTLCSNCLYISLSCSLMLRPGQIWRYLTAKFAATLTGLR